MPGELNWFRQAGAIPVRDDAICLVTSSSGKRWVIPKGLIDSGMSAAETALQESWEEAGLVGVLEADPRGTYLYEKFGSTYHVTVFLLRVTDVAEDWPERTVRERAWVNVKQALERLEDEGLREILRSAIPKAARGSR
jgi:8-oxo-dGTP pyrophosphatase MutT (NUDIX family)